MTENMLLDTSVGANPNKYLINHVDDHGDEWWLMVIDGD